MGFSPFRSELFTGFPTEELNRCLRSFATFFDETACPFSDEKEGLKEQHRSGTYQRLSQDLCTLLSFKENVIGGYLNLGESDGWIEGHDPRVGLSFTRHILSEYF